MKHLLLAALLLLPAIAHGADVGLGASLRDSDATLFVPIERTPAVRIEPFFSWYKEDEDGPGSGSLESLTAGLGMFRKFEIRDRAQVYLGGRVGFSQFKFRTSAGPDQDSEGYTLEPTLGIEYRLVDQVAIAFEALAFYRNSSGQGGTDSDSFGTSNRILLRAYFPP